MNIRNNRATGAIVASGSLLAIIVIGIPWVDDYLRFKRDASELTGLQAKLVENQARDLRLERIEKKLLGELESLSASSVDASKMHSIRETMIRIVRGAGGKLRRLEIADGEIRPWASEEDDPRNDTMPLDGEESDFLLHTHTVELQADGSLESLHTIIQEVQRQGWLMSTKGLTMSPTGVGQTPVTLQIQWILFGLGPHDRIDEDDGEEDLASVPRGKRLR